MNKYTLDLRLHFELDEKHIDILKHIQKCKNENKNYLVSTGTGTHKSLQELENFYLVWKEADNNYFSNYWFLTILGEKFLEKYPLEGD